MSTSCSCCFTDTLAKCEEYVKLNIILPVYGAYRWVITDKFGHKYEGELNDEQTIPVADLPAGLLTQYSGTFKLEIFESGDAACLPVQFFVAGKYTCIDFEITPGNFQKNNLGCEIEEPSPSSGSQEYVATLTTVGAGDPAADVVFNNLGGAIVWNHESTGVYSATSNGLFVPGRTFVEGILAGNVQSVTVDVITFNTVVDLTLTSEYLKIEVYP